MGRGISDKERYQLLYRGLHGIQRKLSKAGVTTVYRGKALWGGDPKAGTDFHIAYEWLGPASNGETMGRPVVWVSHDEHGNQKAWGRNWDYQKGEDWLKRYRKVTVEEPAPS